MTRQGGWPSTGFGGRLKSLREQAGQSQRELAERVGCHYMTISELERGTQEPAWPLVLALAAALGVDVGAFAVPPQTDTAPRARGRPRKAEGEQAGAKGRKRKGKRT
jgi:transcriptional regulator with XRE-family HTH domain